MYIIIDNKFMHTTSVVLHEQSEQCHMVSATDTAVSGVCRAV